MEDNGMNKIVSVEVATTINQFVAGSQVKINFENGDPESFLGVDSLPSVLKAKEGTSVLGNDEMIIGYDEGAAMKKEGLIKGPGDYVKDVFGLPSVKIVGILEPTGTLLDMYHIVNKATLAKMSNVAVVKYVAEKEIIKSFYFVTDINKPEKLKNNIQGFGNVSLGSKTYLPIYIGSSEAKMMIEKKLITKAGDTIDNLFGNDVIVAGILPETGTTLDMMHFVGAGFELK
jgi:hypothetical protein